jgi:hypothetical protein
MIVEAESEPKRHLLQRLGIYGLMLSREVPPLGPGCPSSSVSGRSAHVRNNLRRPPSRAEL